MKSGRGRSRAGYSSGEPPKTAHTAYVWESSNMKTFKSISALIATAGALALIASPAFAGGAFPIPEPGTLSIFAVGVVGAIVVAKLRNRK